MHVLHVVPVEGVVKIALLAILTINSSLYFKKDNLVNETTFFCFSLPF